MRLDIKALALATGILWGTAVLIATLANLVWPTYGGVFLDGLASVYPGYHAGRTVADVFVGTGYAFVDGGIGGGLIACLYNCLSGR
ncbi:MAG TPA: hypothetical protein VJX92_09965 [Methylomirabilota bacterium]|nr:hypothetical protein [Methylomirabilota bacterium]